MVVVEDVEVDVEELDVKLEVVRHNRLLVRSHILYALDVLNLCESFSA